MTSNLEMHQTEVRRGLVGCALAIVVALVAVKASGVSPSLGTTVSLWFFSGLFGVMVGLLLAAGCLDHNPSLAVALAPAIYALTTLPVPFLLYMAFAMIVISALSGMTY